MTVKVEARLERWCVRWARSRGILVSKLTDPTGIPDHVFWVRGGKPVIIEFKAPSGRTSELQMYYIKQFRQRGYKVAVVDNRKAFERLMTEDDRPNPSAAS